VQCQNLKLVKAGVGCFVDSCRTCKSCKAGDEQLCDEGMTGTYNEEGQRFQLTVATPQVLPLMKVLHISDKLELSGVAPLCWNHHLLSLRRLNKDIK
jgi:uncharacterized zinc-type alcohol dehydrogenase-like protein